jgi:tetratricopeptide (TPR) repeat protein
MIAAPPGDPCTQAATGLAAAGALHRAGQLAQAEEAYRRLLQLRPLDVGALTGLGACLAQTGRPADATEFLRRAVAASPDAAAAAPALANLGNVLQAAGRLEEALAAVDQARGAMPGNAQLLVNRGNLLRLLGRPAEARTSYDDALLLDPRNAQARLGRGILLNAAGAHEPALAEFTAAVRAAPQEALAHYNQGVALQALERMEEAAAAFEAALARDAGHADAWLNLAIVRKAQDRGPAALAATARALALRADWPEALATRGHLLQEAGDLQGALDCYTRALAREPDNAGVHLTRGDVLRKLLRCAEAGASYRRGLQLAPDHPDAPGAHLNLAVCHLLAGDLRPGWEELEWRWGDAAILPPHPYPLERLWIGKQDPTGRTVLVHHEQGYGDTLQFCRYVPLLAQRGARVLLEVPPPLHALLASLPGGAQLRSPADPPLPYDLHTPLLSLPLAFGTELASVPAALPYLAAPPDRRAHWRERLAPENRPRIGLAWSGNPRHGNDAQRSINLESLQALVCSPAGRRCAWYSVQKELRAGDDAILARLGVQHPGDTLADFADTAGLLEALDLVISVDTSVAHLAGALGQRLWVLLPYVPDWRWMLGRTDTPWYPQARLFRQAEPGEWADAIARVAQALDDSLASGLAQ